MTNKEKQTALYNFVRSQAPDSFSDHDIDTVVLLLLQMTSEDLDIMKGAVTGEKDTLSGSTPEQNENFRLSMVAKVRAAIEGSLELVGPIEECGQIDRAFIIRTADAVLINCGKHVLWHHVKDAINEVCKDWKVSY